MSISLTPELEQFIQNQVKSGKYTSAEEVIIAGIKLLEERESIYRFRFEELRLEIMVGVEASQRGEVIDGEILFHQLEQKLQKRRQQILKNLKVTVLVENLTSGQVAASILEFPDCRVEADTREKALTHIKTAFLERLKQIQALSWDVPIESLEPIWMQFAGIFKDDLDFKSVIETIQKERSGNDNSEVDPSYYL